MYKNIFSIIDNFRKHPAGYRPECNLFRIETFLNGYEAALLCHEIKEEGENFNSEFEEFLSKKYNINKTGSWAELITGITRSEKEAYEKFFELIEEFLDKNRHKR